MDESTIKIIQSKLPEYINYEIGGVQRSIHIPTALRRQQAEEIYNELLTHNKLKEKKPMTAKKKAAKKKVAKKSK